MLSRLLPLLSLLAAGIIGWQLWASGMLDDIFVPTVTVVETKREILEGQHIRATFIEMKEIRPEDLTGGMITFAKGTSPREAEKELASQQAGRRIENGAIVTSGMLGQKAAYVVLRTTMEIDAGSSITLRNIEATKLQDAPPRGVIVFDTQDEALSYVNESYDLAAKGDIYSGQILTISDTAGGAEKVYVVRASRAFDRAETLSIDGLEVTEISSRDLPRGAIAFPSASAANIFITAADRYVAAETLSQGGFITAEVIASDNGLSALPTGDLPRTMAELTAYMTAFPDQAMIIDDTVMLDGEPEEGGAIDIWVEDSRTGTADSLLGEIRLKRLARDVPIHIVYRDGSNGAVTKEDPMAIGMGDQAAPAATTSTKTPSEIEEEDPSDLTFWVDLKPENNREFRQLWRTDGRVAFMIHSNVNLIDQIGNGASCNEEVCSVNRRASGDMADALALLEPADSEDFAVGGATGSALTILDTVGPDLASRLEAQGYDTLQKIASIQDAEIPQVVMQLNLSNNQVAYIRRQAQLIVTTPETAREELRFNEAEVE